VVVWRLSGFGCGDVARGGRRYDVGIGAGRDDGAIDAIAGEPKERGFGSQPAESIGDASICGEERRCRNRSKAVIRWCRGRWWRRHFGVVHELRSVSCVSWGSGVGVVGAGHMRCSASWEPELGGETGEHVFGSEFEQSAEFAGGAGRGRERCRYVVDLRGSVAGF